MSEWEKKTQREKSEWDLETERARVAECVRGWARQREKKWVRKSKRGNVCMGVRPTKT